MDTWWEPLAEYDGLILRDRVLSSGVDPDQLVIALRTGRLFRVQRGVYGVRAAQPGPLPRARAAVLSSGVLDAVASHHTAGRVFGLAVPGRPVVEHVTVRRELRRVRRRELHFHSRALALGDVVPRDGVALTSPARTVFDLAAYLSRREAVWCVDDALRRNVTTPSALMQVESAGLAVAEMRWPEGGSQRRTGWRSRCWKRSDGLRWPTAQCRCRRRSSRCAMTLVV